MVQWPKSMVLLLGALFVCHLLVLVSAAKENSTTSSPQKANHHDEDLSDLVEGPEDELDEFEESEDSGDEYDYIDPTTTTTTAKPKKQSQVQHHHHHTHVHPKNQTVLIIKTSNSTTAKPSCPNAPAATTTTAAPSTAHPSTLKPSPTTAQPATVKPSTTISAAASTTKLPATGGQLIKLIGSSLSNVTIDSSKAVASNGQVTVELRPTDPKPVSVHQIVVAHNATHSAAPVPTTTTTTTKTPQVTGQPEVKTSAAPQSVSTVLVI